MAVACCGSLFHIIPHCFYRCVHGWADAKSMASCNSRSNILRMCFLILSEVNPPWQHRVTSFVMALASRWPQNPPWKGTCLSFQFPNVSKTCLKQGANLETKGGCLVGKSGREAWPHVVTTQQCTHCLSSTWSWRLTLNPGVVFLDKTYCICGLSPGEWWVNFQAKKQHGRHWQYREGPQPCAKQSRESRDTKSFQDIEWAFGILQITVPSGKPT